MGRTSQRWLATAAASGMLLAATALPAASDEHGERLAVVIDGLDNPRGIAIGDDGTLYVAEGGTGGDEHCVPMDDDEICMGSTSRVVAIDPGDGELSVVVDELPSLMAGEGEYVGVSDVAVADDGSLYLAIGFGEASPVRDGIAEDWAPAALFGTVQHVENGTMTQVADLAAWETANDPDAEQPSTQPPAGQPSDHSNPNGIMFTSDGDLLVVDAGGNTILEVDADTGEITMLALVPERFAPAPPFVELPPGVSDIPVQAVPTNLTETDGGSILISQLTGFPFPVGGASVYELTDTTEPEVVHEGFTNAMDLVAVGSDLYVVELAQDGLLNGPQGALVRVRADGTMVSLLSGELFAPAGVAADADGALYITVGSVGPPGSGAVMRFDPSMAADPATQIACPPLLVGPHALSDIERTTHEEAIACGAWHGVFAGFDDGTFQPNAMMSRGQFASAVARLIRATDAGLPAGASGAFDDVEGTTHATSINDLAAAGIVRGFEDDTFGPNDRLTRGQATSVLVAAYAHITGQTPTAGDATFPDIAGTTHETAIRTAATAGWVRGREDGTFQPHADIRRGQMASAMMRLASALVDEEHLVLPD